MRLAVLFVLLWPGVAQAQSAGEAATLAAERLAQAGNQLADATSARNRVEALTKTVRAYEDGLIAMRDGLRRAAIRQTTLETALAAKSDEIGQLLGVLQTMGRAPTPLLLLHPSGPTGTARPGMMVADVAPATQAEVNTIRSELE